MNEEAPGRWQYESDGEPGARTHYAIRDNPAAPCGIDRRDFGTAAEARAWVRAVGGEREADGTGPDPPDAPWGY